MSTMLRKNTDVCAQRKLSIVMLDDPAFLQIDFVRLDSKHCRMNCWYSNKQGTSLVHVFAKSLSHLKVN